MAIKLPTDAWEINPQRTAEGEVMICGGEPYGLVAVVTAEEDARTIVQCVAERPALIAERDRLRGTLRKVLAWAEARCPCHDETPNPCPLCGASVENLEGCKSAENTLPPDILTDLRRAALGEGK